MGWRARLFALHRDAGYLAVGLTVVYAVSGVAVNHRRDWDADWVREERQLQVGRPTELLASLPESRRVALTADPGALSSEEEAALVGRLVVVLGRERKPLNVFWRGRDRLSLFFEAGERDTVDYFPATGEALHRTARERLLLGAFNHLHLNEARRAWTWIADGFAVVLLFLALSGAVMVRGRTGLRGRGWVLVGLGAAVPALALLLLR